MSLKRILVQFQRLMKRNDNAAGDCECDQFYQVEVCTERDEDCAVSLEISCRPYLRPVEKKSYVEDFGTSLLC